MADVRTCCLDEDGKRCGHMAGQTAVSKKAKKLLAARTPPLAINEKVCVRCVLSLLYRFWLVLGLAISRSNEEPLVLRFVVHVAGRALVYMPGAPSACLRPRYCEDGRTEETAHGRAIS